LVYSKPWISQATLSVTDQRRKVMWRGDLKERWRRSLRHDEQQWTERTTTWTGSATVWCVPPTETNVHNHVSTTSFTDMDHPAHRYVMSSSASDAVTLRRVPSLPSACSTHVRSETSLQSSMIVSSLIICICVHWLRHGTMLSTARS